MDSKNSNNFFISQGVIKPWILSVPAAVLTYLMFWMVRFEGWREFYFWISLATFPIGVGFDIVAKFTKAPTKVRWVGGFLVNWFFCAYIVSFFTR